MQSPAIDVENKSKPYVTIEQVAQSYHGSPKDDGQRKCQSPKTSLARALYHVPVNCLASLVVFGLYLISIESLISIALSVGLTIYVYEQTDENSEFNGNIMNWVLLSFAVVTPISAVIGMAYNRREAALRDLADMRSTLLQLYTSHAIWDWDAKPSDSTRSGRAKSTVDWREHSDSVLTELFGIASDVTDYLALPTASRARHKIFPNFQNEAKQIQSKASRFQKTINSRFAKLSKYCEALKREGMPGNESSRIRQWERDSSQYFERLRMIKNYRTPQALRSFSRLFSMFLPPFYAPFYAEMAHQLNSLGTALAFAIITSLALTGLFEATHQLEDPFVRMSVLDGIYVEQILIGDLVPDLLQMRSIYFDDAPDFDSYPRPLEASTCSAVRIVAE